MVDKSDTRVTEGGRGAAPQGPAPANVRAQKTRPAELLLKGTARQRGRVHGEALRGKIGQAVEAWKEELGREIGATPENYIAELVGSTKFEAATRRWTPDLLDEVAGLAEGASVPFKTMYAFQLVDEDWWFRRNRRYGVELPGAEKCSVVAVHDDGNATSLLAQNIDIPAWSDGLQVLLRIRDGRGDGETLVFSYAGVIGLGGVNSRAVAVCVNALMQLDQRPDGLPVAFVVRGILAQPTLGDAVRFIREVPHASGQAYTVGGPEGVVGLECSAHSVCHYPAAPGTRCLLHTNHPLASDDQSVFRQLAGRMPAEQLERSRTNSERRLESCARRFGNPVAPVDAAAVMGLLCSHDDPDASVCAHGGAATAAFSAWSVIYEFGPEPAVHLTCGPPCRSDYRRIGLAGRPR